MRHHQSPAPLAHFDTVVLCAIANTKTGFVPCDRDQYAACSVLAARELVIVRAGNYFTTQSGEWTAMLAQWAPRAMH